MSTRTDRCPSSGPTTRARNATWFDPNMRMPYVMNWSGGFQYQFSNTWLAELLYQGSSGVGLLNNWDINVVPLNVSTDPVQLESDPHAVSELQAVSAVRFHPALFKLRPQYATTGQRCESRSATASGLTLNSFWTFSKTMNDVDDDDGSISAITFYNRQVGKGARKLRHEPPLGFNDHLGTAGRQGQAVHDVTGWRNAVFGGWELMGSQHFQSGPPFTVTCGQPERVSTWASRPIQIEPNDEVKLEHVDIGGNRFPFSAQNRYINGDGSFIRRPSLPERSAATPCRRRASFGGRPRWPKNGRS